MSERDRRSQGNPDLPKPYDFVPLPPTGSDPTFIEASGHHLVLGTSAAQRLTGTISARLVAESPLGVASGRVVPIDTLLQYGDIAADSLGDDTIAMEHTRSRGTRIIPGSSLKGVIRSTVEAISHTGTTFTPTPRDRTRRSNGRPVAVTEIRNRVEQPGFMKTDQPPRLSLSARLFGITSGRHGYQGHCTVADAPQESGGGRIFRRLPLYSPQPDYSQSLPELTTRWERYFTDRSRTRYRGRKFYLAGEPREVEPPYNAAEVCAAGSTFGFRLSFANLSGAELGVLLIVLGAGGEIPRLRLGGGKPLALGTIRVEDMRVQLTTRERYLDFDEGGDREVGDLDGYLEAARTSEELFADGLRELARIAQTRASYTAGGDDRNY